MKYVEESHITKIVTITWNLIQHLNAIDPVNTPWASFVKRVSNTRYTKKIIIKQTLNTSHAI